MKKTIIHFIRHGQTLYNLEKRIQGSVDIELSDFGVKQAESILSSNFLEKYDVSYHSSLSRSQKTLEIILDSKKINVTKRLSDLLIERGYGFFEGLQDNVIQSKYPDIYHQWKENENTYIEGAEKIESVVNRIQKFIKNMVVDDYQNVLAVTHSGVLYALYKFITNTKLGVRPSEVSFPNCCSVYLDIYHTNNGINKLELHIQDQTYVYCCSPAEMIVTAT